MSSMAKKNVSNSASFLDGSTQIISNFPGSEIYNFQKTQMIIKKYY